MTNVRDKCNQDFHRFLDDFPFFDHWRGDPSIRSTPRESNKTRLEQDSFSVESYLEKIEVDHVCLDKIKILFAHFSPLDYEMEALGLPCFVSKAYPNATIDLTYDKGPAVFRFTLQGGKIIKKDKLLDEYDLIVGRSSVFKCMAGRTHDLQVLNRSKVKVNVKTMSLASNLVYADRYFDEEEMCPPPDPEYLAQVDRFLQEHQKQDIVVVSGTLWYVKNQLKMFEQLDPAALHNYKVVIIGPTRDKDYTSRIIQICDSKKIDYYLLGRLNKSLAHQVKTLSKISLIPMDMRAYGQPKGYPRTLGESIGSMCLTVCNKPVTIPSYYKHSCLVYDETVANDFNEKLQQATTIVTQKDYMTTYKFRDYRMEDLCREVMDKCLALLNNRG